MQRLAAAVQILPISLPSRTRGPLVTRHPTVRSSPTFATLSSGLLFDLQRYLQTKPSRLSGSRLSLSCHPVPSSGKEGGAYLSQHCKNQPNIIPTRVCVCLASSAQESRKNKDSIPRDNGSFKGMVDVPEWGRKGKARDEPSVDNKTHIGVLI